jgi:hypothetical protein
MIGVRAERLFDSPNQRLPAAPGAAELSLAYRAATAPQRSKPGVTKGNPVSFAGDIPLGRMSESGPSRHFSRMQNFVAIGAKRTWPDLLLARPGRERPEADINLIHLRHLFETVDRQSATYVTAHRQRMLGKVPPRESARCVQSRSLLQ